MTKNLFIRVGILVLSTFVVMGSFISCEKTEPTIAKIIAVDKDGLPLIGAEITLYNDAPLEDENPDNDESTLQFPDGIKSVTGSGGIAEIDMSESVKSGQTGFTVMKINATYVDKNDTLEGSGVITIKEFETSEATVPLFASIE